MPKIHFIAEMLRLRWHIIAHFVPIKYQCSSFLLWMLHSLELIFELDLPFITIVKHPDVVSVMEDKKILAVLWETQFHTICYFNLIMLLIN